MIGIACFASIFLWGLLIFFSCPIFLFWFRGEFPIEGVQILEEGAREEEVTILETRWGFIADLLFTWTNVDWLHIYFFPLCLFIYTVMSTSILLCLQHAISGSCRGRRAAWLSGWGCCKWPKEQHVSLSNDSVFILCYWYVFPAYAYVCLCTVLKWMRAGQTQDSVRMGTALMRNIFLFFNYGMLYSLA